MYTIKRTNSTDSDFQKLITELDRDLAIRDGAEHSFFAQFNKIDTINYVVVAYENEIAVGCGAIKQFESHVMEVKRMYVPLEKRKKGIASAILRELENWAKELGYTKCILETGKKQPEALQLYNKNNYTIIQNYGPYVEVESSVCFEKLIL